MEVKWNHLIAATLIALIFMGLRGAPVPAMIVGFALAWGWNIFQALRKRRS